MNNKIEQQIIEEVYKHHNMKMTTECVKGLLTILKKHCPHYNKECCDTNDCLTTKCKCNPCTCNPCKC